MNLMEPGIRLCYSGQAVIMVLIVCGGLGFGIYKEINSRLANRFFPNTAACTCSGLLISNW